MDSGGRIDIAGLWGGEICVHPYKEAGKACSGKSQCEGLCLADDTQAEIGTPAEGRCQAEDYPFGCRTEIRDGKIADSICVD